MARVTPVSAPEGYPGAPDTETQKNLTDLFTYLFPDGNIGAPHAGYGILAHSPKLALSIAKMSDCILGDIEWTQRRDLRELSVQTLNLHFHCDFSFHAHLPLAQLSGISLEQQAALPYWRTSHLFDEEQRLVIEYTMACVAGDVPADLFARVVERYGEKGAVEFTVTVGWWSLWAMLLNAVRPDFKPDRAQPLPKDSRELESFTSPE